MEIQLGGAPYEHALYIDGKPWTNVLSLVIENDDDGVPVATFKCDLDERFELSGRMKPTKGLPPEPVDIRLVMHDFLTQCMIAGHSLRMTHVKVWADGTSTTFLEIDARLGDEDDLSVTRIEGFMLPKLEAVASDGNDDKK
jgi:hypothetical protein